MPRLQLISQVTNKSITSIFDEFIDELFKAVFPHAKFALENKTKVLFEVSISAAPLDSSFIIGSRKVDFSKSNAQLDKELVEHLEKQYEEKEKKEEVD